jgi:hypothetical protein
VHQLELASIHDVLALQSVVVRLIFVALLHCLLPDIAKHFRRDFLLLPKISLRHVLCKLLEVVLLSVDHFEHAFVKNEFRVLGQDGFRLLG